MLIGRVLNSLVDRIDRPETAELAKGFLRQLQESGSVEREIKDLLSDLGIGQE